MSMPAVEESPEWAAARNDWRAQADASLAGLQQVISTAQPGLVERQQIYAPVHDIAGLAPVFEYHLLGRIARSLMEGLRNRPDPLDAATIEICRTFITTMSALHARNVRGNPNSTGEALLAKLASLIE